MIMSIHPSADGTMLELDVWWTSLGRPQIITFTRRTRSELDRIVRTITRSNR